MILLILILLQAMAQMKLVVAFCAAGTDYQPNHYGKSFGTSRQVTADITEASTADVLLEKVPFGYYCLYCIENFLQSLCKIFLLPAGSQ